MSQCTDRERLSCIMRAGGSRVCVVVAPSGYGKSIAAAQFALEHPLGIWIDASDGRISDGRGVAQETLRSMRATLPDHSLSSLDGLEAIPLADLLDGIETLSLGLPDGGVCIVVDDIAGDYLGEAVLVARQVGAVLRNRARFVFTARGLGSAREEVVRNCAVLGSDELRLTETEAAELLDSQYPGCGMSGRAATLRAECDGHIALFSVLSRNPSAGVDTIRDRNTSTGLQLWMDHLIDTQLSSDQKALVVGMALLKTGTSAELRSLGVACVDEDARHLATVLPLISLDSTSCSGVTFVVHDSISESWLRENRNGWQTSEPDMGRRSVPVLTARGSFVRAAQVLALIGDRELCAAWLLENGTSLLDSSHSEALPALLDQLPLSTLFSHPRLLLLSAAVAAQAENYEDALARSRAALSLADHAGDTETKVEATARAVHCLCNLGQFDRASALSAELMRQPLDDLAKESSASALLALGIQAAARGEYIESERALSRVLELVGEDGRSSRTGMLARLFSSIIPGVSNGDFSLSARRLAPLIDCQHMWLTDRLGARGNLAVCLCELGKLERARLILREVLERAASAGLRTLSGCFLPTLGSVEAGLGSIEVGLELLRDGIRISLEVGDEQGAQVNRIYLATVLRSCGSVEESLMHAERAYEHLSVADVFRCRRLAALEVAANFLALGDTSTTVAWTEAACSEGFDGNQYHELRADMILAEVERRRGCKDIALARLARHSAYVASGNSNWQVAMYCRAFPHMLGLFAGAIGVEALPSHLLAMIPGKSVDQSLSHARTILEAAPWQELCARLEGDAHTSECQKTETTSICHVRVFGGLEVRIDSRIVRESDWRKRKARLLFAMLVLRRGQDVPRDQVLEHLWPDMDEDRARNNLYVAWSTMKSVLGGKDGVGTKSPYVESAHGVCRAVHGRIRTDMDEFDDALAEAKSAMNIGDTAAAMRAFEQVASAYRADLLPGDVYDDWFSGVRANYRALYIDAMCQAATLLLADGDGLNALAFARKAMQADELREDLYQVQMRCQIQAFQRSSAIDTYLLCVRRLSEELGLDPSAETRALYDEILAMEDTPSKNYS